MNSTITIPLGVEDVTTCIKFAKEVAPHQQAIEFQNQGFSRSISEIERDTTIGKLAELGVARFLYNKYSIVAVLDYNVYPNKGTGDMGDITLPGGSILEVKGTRQGGRWLLVTPQELLKKKERKCLPQYVAGVVVGWNRNTDGPTGHVVIQGYAFLADICKPGLLGMVGLTGHDMCSPSLGTTFLNEGECIPSTQVPLQSDNFARKFVDLHTTWDKIIQEERTPTYEPYIHDNR